MSNESIGRIKKQLPMWATASRIFLTPVCIYLVMHVHPLIATIAFILTAATDYIDGYWARKFGATSDLGKFMDPIADKVLVTGLLIYLVAMDRVPPSMVLILIARDLVIGGLRQVAASQGIIIAAKAFGKTKTALQMVAIPVIIAAPALDRPLLSFPIEFDLIGQIGLWVSVVLSLISAADYGLGYFRQRKAAS